MNEKTRNVAINTLYIGIGIALGFFVYTGSNLLGDKLDARYKSIPSYAKIIDVNADSLPDIVTYNKFDKIKKMYIAVRDTNTINYFEAEALHQQRLKDKRAIYENEINKLDSLKAVEMSELENVLKNMK